MNAEERTDQNAHDWVGCIKTNSGIAFDIEYPTTDMVDINDIATALGMICRYNGQVPSFYSVAEHSVRVAQWLIDNDHEHLALGGLMHDAAEAYIGDIVRPMKLMPQFAEVYNELEIGVERCIGLHFDLDLYPMHPTIKAADKAVYEWEVEHIRTGKQMGQGYLTAISRFMDMFEKLDRERTNKTWRKKELVDEAVELVLANAEGVDDLSEAHAMIDSLAKSNSTLKYDYYLTKDGQVYGINGGEFTKVDHQVELGPEGDFTGFTTIEDLPTGDFREEVYQIDDDPVTFNYDTGNLIINNKKVIVPQHVVEVTVTNEGIEFDGIPLTLEQIDSLTEDDFVVEDLPLGGKLIVDEKVQAMRKEFGEVRVTNPITGGEKGSKIERFDLIPVYPLTVLAKHYGLGALKYDSNQWRKGYEYSLSYAALQRHLTAWWNGEDLDPEFGDSHLAAVAWHAFTLLEFTQSHPEMDDRYHA